MQEHVRGTNKPFMVLLAVAVAVGAVACIAVQWVLKGPEVACGQPQAAREGSIAVYMSPLEANRAVICLVDETRSRLMVYQVDFGRQRLKLVAVRDFTADLGLNDYNNEPPLPKDIRAWLEGKKSE